MHPHEYCDPPVNTLRDAQDNGELDKGGRRKTTCEKLIVTRLTAGLTPFVGLREDMWVIAKRKRSPGLSRGNLYQS